MSSYPLLFVIPLLFALASVAIADAPPQVDKDPAQYIRVEIKGKLETGLMAIGGETTGTVIAAKGVTWELEVGNNAELRMLAESLSGKAVIVKGTYEVRKGVEIKQRHIVTVTSLTAAK